MAFQEGYHRDPSQTQTVSSFFAFLDSDPFHRSSGVSNLFFINDELLFVQPKDRPMIPLLKLLHKYPYIMPQLQCDKGAIKHVLTGADIMCPGLTSPGGKIDPVITKGQVVVLFERE